MEPCRIVEMRKDKWTREHVHFWIEGYEQTFYYDDDWERVWCGIDPAEVTAEEEEQIYLSLHANCPRGQDAKNIYLELLEWQLMRAPLQAIDFRLLSDWAKSKVVSRKYMRSGEWGRFKNSSGKSFDAQQQLEDMYQEYVKTHGTPRPGNPPMSIA